MAESERVGANYVHQERILCRGCSKLLKRNEMASGYCSYCRKIVYSRKRAMDPRDKYQIRFDNATEAIQKQVRNFSEYEKSIAIAKRRMYDYGSIPEAMVAIELLRLGYKIIPQQRILNYHVDFCLPDVKLVVEVDGNLFHKQISERDLKIKLMLGTGWKIIHLPAEEIRNNIQKLQKCIELYK